MARWLYDTSVFIAMETGRPIAALPAGELTVSVMTVGELQLGVHSAPAEEVPLRMETIAEVEHSWNPIPVDVAVMRRFASMMADARRRGRKPGLADGIIAATAAVHGFGVVTQDREFEAFLGLDVVYV